MSILLTLDVINAMRYYHKKSNQNLFMITHFSCSDTEDLFNGKRVKRFVNIERVAMRKLQQIHAAMNLQFLRVPPANHLELLSGNRQGQYSIRINSQWRICFVWNNGNVSHVEIVDYH